MTIHYYYQFGAVVPRSSRARKGKAGQARLRGNKPVPLCLIRFALSSYSPPISPLFSRWSRA